MCPVVLYSLECSNFVAYRMGFLRFTESLAFWFVVLASSDSLTATFSIE